jgi:hypothetical protein
MSEQTKTEPNRCTNPTGHWWVQDRDRTDEWVCKYRPACTATAGKHGLGVKLCPCESGKAFGLCHGAPAPVAEAVA